MSTKYTKFYGRAQNWSNFKKKKGSGVGLCKSIPVTFHYPTSHTLPHTGTRAYAGGAVIMGVTGEGHVTNQADQSQRYTGVAAPG